MISLKEYVKTLPESERDIFRMAFGGNDYEKQNQRFELCYELAKNLTKINTPKTIRAAIKLEVIPARYINAILSIATKLKPKNENYYRMCKTILVGFYVDRLKKVANEDEVSLLLCEKQKHKKEYISLQERVMDDTERKDIILSLGYDGSELNGNYKGKEKLKTALNELYKPISLNKNKKLEAITDETFVPIMNAVLQDLNQLDKRVHLV